MESTESRYTHLLQPIRELTKNWEIDLASELNDYLEEVTSASTNNICVSNMWLGAQIGPTCGAWPAL